MKTFPAAFTIEKNKKTGAKPIWIARLITPSADYYLAGKIIAIPGFAGSSVWPASTPVNTLAWVSSFGNIVEGINGAIDEFKVSEMSISTIIDTEANVNIETLVLIGIEGCVVELYEWFVGCSDPPQRIFIGKVRAVTDYNDTTIVFTIQDDTIDLEKYYVGNLINNKVYPLADPADIGKIIPIPFGTVSKIPSLCVYNVPYYKYMFMFSDRPVTTITKVWARNKGIADIDITSYCFPFTGNPGDQVSHYLGKGIIMITDTQAAQIQELVQIAITAVNLTAVGIDDGGHSHSIGASNVSVDQNTTSSLPVLAPAVTPKTFDFGTVSGTRTRITYTASVNVANFNGNPTCEISINNNYISIGTLEISTIGSNVSQNTTSSLPIDVNGGGTGDITFSFDAISGTKTKIEYSVTATLLAFSDSIGMGMRIYINDVQISYVEINNWTIGQPRTFTGSVNTNLTGDTITVGTTF